MGKYINNNTTSINSLKRIGWIDNLRGFCMLAILLDHTESYYLDYHIINQNLYLTDALVFFFILSGYLMYKPQQQFCIAHKMKSIGRSLLMPYFIFTSLLALPKAIVHGASIDILNIFQSIIMGKASWFVAALIVAEILFSISLWITHEKDRYILPICTIAFGISGWIPQTTDCYFWQLDNSLQAMLFCCIGYIIHKHEQSIYKKIKTSQIILLLILWITIKIYVDRTYVMMTIWRINITNYPLFILNILIGTLATTTLFKKIPSCKWLEWTGRHCIVYYFLCGGIPFCIGKICNHLHLSYSGNYLSVVGVFLIVYLCTTLVTWFIYRYLPFITGQKRVT